jgi:thiamine biosynthesis lipoprotein
MKSPCIEFKRARPLLGTIVEITLLGTDLSRCEEAFEQAFGAITLVQQRMSFHDPSSTLSRINTDASNGPVAVDDKTFRVLRMAHLFYSSTNGIFDPTIAPQLQRAGFLPRRRGERQPRAASFGDVELLPKKRIRFRRAGTRLDLGGIAKGFAVDEAVTILRRTGIKCGLVNAGGDLRAFGARPFAVGIRDPRRPGTTFASLVLKNCALATSAHYFAARLKPGAQLGPFVDPQFGEFRSELASVTVVAKSALIADALTKVVMLDPDNSLAILQRFAGESLVCTTQGTVFSTPYWHERLQAAA